MPRTLPQEDDPRCTPGSLPTGDPRSIRPLLVGHAVDSATAHYPPSTTTAKSKPTPPLAQHGLGQLRGPGSDLGRQRAVDRHGRHPRRPRAIPAMGLAAHRRPPRPHSGRTPVDAETPGQRTPTGHRTPNTGHLDAQTPTPDTGRVDRHPWTLAPDTGRRTLAEDTDRVTTALSSASGPPGPPGE
jgi:hypothetical protein